MRLTQFIKQHSHSFSTYFLFNCFQIHVYTERYTSIILYTIIRLPSLRHKSFPVEVMLLERTSYTKTYIPIYMYVYIHVHEHKLVNLFIFQYIKLDSGSGKLCLAFGKLVQLSENKVLSHCLQFSSAELITLHVTKMNFFCLLYVKQYEYFHKYLAYVPLIKEKRT